MKRGFTLVELSIVLVIIGLLIGGILVAQSMTSTAKVTKQIQQISEFDAGVMAFIAKQNSLPGDSISYGGDGDGVIEDQYTNLNSTFSGDIRRFWNNWNPDKYTYTSSNTIVSEGAATKHVPSTIMGIKGSRWFASGLTNSHAAIDITRGNWYYMAVANSPTPSGAYQGRFPAHVAGTSPAIPAELAAIDTKIDNGVANTGIVQASGIDDGGGGAPGHGGIGRTALATCASGANYRLDLNAYNCTPIVRIGGIAGDPK